MNGSQKYKYLTCVEPGEVYEYKITDNETEYVFSINGLVESISKGCSGGGKNYRLYPYFGGDEVARHDIFIKIKEL